METDASAMSGNLTVRSRDKILCMIVTVESRMEEEGGVVAQ